MRLTRKNPNGSYRIPMCTQKTIRMEWQQEELNVFGEVANLLGEYEDLGTPKELRELLKQKGDPCTGIHGPGYVLTTIIIHYYDSIWRA